MFSSQLEFALQMHFRHCRLRGNSGLPGAGLAEVDRDDDEDGNDADSRSGEEGAAEGDDVDDDASLPDDVDESRLPGECCNSVLFAI